MVLNEDDDQPQFRHGYAWDILECVEVLNHCRNNIHPVDVGRIMGRTSSSVVAKAYILVTERVRELPAEIRMKIGMMKPAGYYAAFANNDALWRTIREALLRIDNLREEIAVYESKPRTERRD